MTDERICKKTRYGQHINVRCKGCGAVFSTKNIGGCDPVTKQAYPQRSVFNIRDFVGCTCPEGTDEPLVHDCSIDHEQEEDRESPMELDIHKFDNLCTHVI